MIRQKQPERVLDTYTTNKFNLTIDYSKASVCIEDDFDVSPSGSEVVPIADFMKIITHKLKDLQDNAEASKNGDEH